jgi:hypothetical protein
MAEPVVVMAEPLEFASDRDAASYRDASMRLLEMFLDKAKRLADERISLGNASQEKRRKAAIERAGTTPHVSKKCWCYWRPTPTLGPGGSTYPSRSPWGSCRASLVLLQLVQLLVHPRHRTSLPTAVVSSAVGRGIHLAPPALLITVVGAVRLLHLVSLQLILLLVLS